MRTLSNVLLASLAWADLLLIIVCVPVKFAQLFSFTWEFGNFSCKFVHYMQNVSSICSVYTLTAISIERYYAILHPVKSRYVCTMSHTRALIIITWIFSLITASPILEVQILEMMGSRRKGFWCWKNPDEPIQWRVYEVYMLTLILVIPCIVMGFTYTCICKKLWIMFETRAAMVCGQHNYQTISRKLVKFDDFAAHPFISLILLSFASNRRGIELKSSRGQMSDAGSCKNNNGFYAKSRSFKQSPIQANKAEEDNMVVQQVIKMLVAVVILFIICWSPILIINVLTAFGLIQHLNYGYLKPLRTAAHLLSYLNSCINPIIYGFMSKNFRASFKEALTKCLSCRSGARNNRSSSLSYRISSTLLTPGL